MRVSFEKGKFNMLSSRGLLKRSKVIKNNGRSAGDLIN